MKLAQVTIPTAKVEQERRGAEQAAKGGIQYLLELLAEEDYADNWQEANGMELTVGSRSVVLSIEDEGSKIQVNAATEKLLLGLNLGRGQVDALLDWRDLDQNPRAQGAEASYYREQAEPILIRDCLIPAKEELLLLRYWQGEETLISKHLTVSGSMNINSMSYESLDALLAALKVDKFASQAIVNDFIVAKSQGTLWHDLESFAGSLPSLGPILRQKLEKHLTAEPIVNVNTASERVLGAWCHYLDLGGDLARWIVWRRESAPFEALEEIIGRVPAETKARLPLFFTTHSSIFALEARSGSVWVRAIVQRRDEELEILSWYTGSEGKESNEEA